MILDSEYFTSNDTIKLAHSLIGKFIFRKFENGPIKSFMITEVEAYHGFEDKASHARFGKTLRNSIMFEEGGHIYLYLCYGIHWLLNITTGEKNFPAAILIRGIDNIYGPGKVTKLLQLDNTINLKPFNKHNGLWIEDLQYTPEKVIELKRVGINYAEEYIHKLWRFKIGT